MPPPSAPPPTPPRAPCSNLLGFQIDSLAVNSLRCGVYWQSSMPSGSAGPNAAVRVGMRVVANTVAHVRP